MIYYLNIGLAREGEPDNSAPDTLAQLMLLELDDPNAEVITWSVVTSDTEKTVIAAVYLPGGVTITHNRIAALAETLGQDCIAAYCENTRTGALLGPRAAQWGEFNPEYFFLLNGTRLADTTLPRAA